MSYQLQKLCHKILQEIFGEIVANVGQVLFKLGTNPLRVIKGNINIPEDKVREALAVLIQHNLVTYNEWHTNIPAYTLEHERILLMVRFPRYVYMVRERFGEESELLVDMLLKEGQSSASHIIVHSCLKLHEAPGDGGGNNGYEERHVTVKNHLLQLIENEFIQRCPVPQDSKVAVPVLTITDEQLYSFPSELLDLKSLQQDIQLRMNGNKNPGVVHKDSDVLWRINYDKFHMEFRDQEIRNSLVRRVDPLAGECLGAVLKVSYTRSDPWAPTMNVVTAGEVRDQLKDLQYLDQYLKILEEESGGCVQRFGDAGGGQYRVDMAAAYTTLVYTTVDNCIQERFGSKAARVFRLIREHHMLEQDQVGEMSMISKKEANLLSYRLLHDNFIRLHEVRKTLAPSPMNKNIFLFHVDMVAVVKMLLEWCYKALYNLIVQREMRTQENRRLLEKRTRVDTIVENLKATGGTEDQIQEVEEMVSPAEREIVEQVLATQDRLFESETGLDDTMFILQMYLYYKVKTN